MADLTTTIRNGINQSDHEDCQYRQILDNTMLPLVVTSLESQNILYLNQAAALFSGLERKRAIGLNALNLWTMCPNIEKNSSI